MCADPYAFERARIRRALKPRVKYVGWGLRFTSPNGNFTFRLRVKLVTPALLRWKFMIDG